jgi:hypothetical protein
MSPVQYQKQLRLQEARRLTLSGLAKAMRASPEARASSD